MRDCVTASVAARLHLGFLDLNGGLGRRFGSLGMAIEEPVTTFDLWRGAENIVEGPEAERAGAYLGALSARLGLPGGHRLQVHSAIPAHAGLGSGTQLALAIGAALRTLHGLAPDFHSDASLLGRSTRSGLGQGFFHEGGIALDGGRADGDKAAPIIARLPIPDDWRVLLILDPSRYGLHGDEELAAFKALPPFPPELAAHLCRIALMQALPAAVESDLPEFGRAVTEIQAQVGDYFSAAQGGRYASPAVTEILALLAKNGVEGFGQSSWGPTGFAFAASPSEVRRLHRLASGAADASGLELMIVKGRNRGAVISERAGARQRGARHG